jgi:hypothetical protein
MNAQSSPAPGTFDHLREHSIGLPQTLFQSITHMAPGAAIAFSILVSVQFSGPALPLAVLVALVACLLVANSIGQLAKQMPSAGGLYTYVSRALGPAVGFMVGWVFILFEPLVAPLLFLIFAWATTDVMRADVGWDWTGQWWIWVLVAAAIVFFLTYRDVRLSTDVGVLLGIFDQRLRRAVALDDPVEHRRPHAPDLQPPQQRGRHLRRDLQGDGVRDSRLHRLRGGSALRRGGAQSAPDDSTRGYRLGAHRRPLLRLLFVRLGHGHRLQQLHGGHARSGQPVAEPGGSTGRPGWVLVFLAIINSAIANANAGVNAATRVVYAMGRNGVLPRMFARTHPVHKTPHVAIIAQTIFGVVMALLFGLKWGRADRIRRDGDGPDDPRHPRLHHRLHRIDRLLLEGAMHRVQRLARRRLSGARRRRLPGAALLPVQPLPDYPMRYANWFAIVWIAIGLVVTAWMWRTRRQSLENAERIFVDDIETAAAPALGAAR